MSYQQVPLRRVFKIVNGGTPTSDERNWDGSVPWATPVDLGRVDGGSLAGTNRTITAEGLQAGSASIPSNSILLSTRAPIGYVALVRKTTAFNQGCRGLIPTQQVDVRFFQYQLLALRQSLIARANGTTFLELSSRDLADVPVLLPSPDIQRAIANYLDAETARIATLKDKKEALLALLQERRQGTVDRAIRLLDKQYKSVPLKRVAGDIQVGIVITPAAWYTDSGGVPALRGVNVTTNGLDLGDVVYLSEEGHRYNRKSVLRTYDIVVVRTGQAGTACVIPESLDGCNCIDLLIVRRNQERLDSEYLSLVLNSDWVITHIASHAVGSIQSHFNVAAMKELLVPVPPLDEQRRCTLLLRGYLEQVTTLEARLRSQIELLGEHRQALISAAVTGQLDIPGVAA